MNTIGIKDLETRLKVLSDEYYALMAKKNEIAETMRQIDVRMAEISGISKELVSYVEAERASNETVAENVPRPKTLLKEVKNDTED